MNLYATDKEDVYKRQVHGDILEEKLLRLWEWQNRRFIPKETV